MDQSGDVRTSPGTSGESGTHSGSSTGKKDGLTRLLEKQFEEITAVSQKIELCKQYQKDYNDLKKQVHKLQGKIRHPYRIPIAGTKLAFVNGHIIHTNELHVLLGYNYFALRSSRQATQIIDRRVADLEEKVKLCEDARRKTEDWLNVTRDHKRDREEFVEIIETM